MNEPLLTTIPLWATAAGAAWVAAFSASGHCAVMCGPLACAGGRISVARWKTTLAWHSGRVSGYTFVGGLLGTLGQGAAALISHKVAHVLPWVMAAGLLIAAFDLGRRVRLPKGLAQVAHGLLRVGAGFSPMKARFLAGAATPLLPCGVLWGGYVAALGAGSAWGGGVVMAAFSLGAVPALGLLQTQQAWLSRWPRVEVILRRGLPLVAAAVLVWRALHAGGPAAGVSCH